VKLEVIPDAKAAAREAARVIATEAHAAVAARGRFLVAMSGGQTPWVMLRALADEAVPWASVHVFQVDERIAPAGDPDRNLTHLRESLLSRVSLPSANLHAMPVEAGDLEAAAGAYAATLASFGGAPPVLDLVHLGLGSDGHTASLVPNDPVLNVADRDVALAGVYMGRRRMTLTFPVLDRARKILWLVTGAGKAPLLKRLLAHDAKIPAGRVRPENALVFADRDAAGAGQRGKGEPETR
jgi:6-phosphogluconolactonase